MIKDINKLACSMSIDAFPASSAYVLAAGGSGWWNKTNGPTCSTTKPCASS